MRRLHAGLMETLLPTLAIDLEDPLYDAQDQVWLEIGFGGGEHLAHQAALNPHVTVIGAEAYLNGVAKLLSEVEARNLANVRIHYGDARVLLEKLPARSIDRVYLLYPDPWPKGRQNKRRFVNAENLAALHRILKPQGQFWFASDIADYGDWTLDHVTTSTLFTVEGEGTQPFENWVQTRYEAKARREGRSTAYLRFQKSG